VARGKKYKNIYFEPRGGGKESAFEAVRDAGRRGVDSWRELKLIAAAQLADLVDLKTKDHSGKLKRFTPRTWAGRSKILWLLFYRLKRAGKIHSERAEEHLKIITGAYSYVASAKTARERRERIREVLRRVGLKPGTISRLLSKTN